MNNKGGVNKVILAGQVTQQPQWCRDTADRTLCFTLVTKENVTSAKGTIVHEENHQIRISERCPSLKYIELNKGDFIYIQGKIQTIVTVGDDQIKRYKTEILAISVEALGITTPVIR